MGAFNIQFLILFISNLFLCYFNHDILFFFLISFSIFGSLKKKKKKTWTNNQKLILGWRLRCLLYSTTCERVYEVAHTMQYNGVKRLTKKRRPEQSLLQHDNRTVSPCLCFKESCCMLCYATRDWLLLWIDESKRRPRLFSIPPHYSILSHSPLPSHFCICIQIDSRPMTIGDYVTCPSLPTLPHPPPPSSSSLAIFFLFYFFILFAFTFFSLSISRHGLHPSLSLFLYAGRDFLHLLSSLSLSAAALLFKTWVAYSGWKRGWCCGCRQLVREKKTS